MNATVQSDGTGAEAERQLAAAAERHREAVNSMQEPGRPEAGQHIAVKSAGRAVHLVSYALKRAVEAGVPFERLVELTGWEPELVREGLERLPEEPVVARLAPKGVDASAIAHAAVAFESLRRLHELTQRLLVDVDRDADAALAPADVQALHDCLETACRAWRGEAGSFDA